MMQGTLSFIPLLGIPEISAGACIPDLLETALKKTGGARPGDILVITHKIISKALGLTAGLKDITPSKEAEHIASLTGKDARTVQAVLDSSETLHVCERGLLIAERPDGWICCNAGVDLSNAGGRERLVLLSFDGDNEARGISLALHKKGISLPVIICDTHGRALRSGACGVAVGIYGMDPVRPYIGEKDREGRVMTSTVEAAADEIAGAATLVMGQGAEGVPAVLVRGYSYVPSKKGSAALTMPAGKRLYSIGSKKKLLSVSLKNKQS